MNKQQEKSTEAKKTIRKAALALFKEKGYTETSIKDICLQSGYSVGAFYHHHTSKASILDAAYQDFDELIKDFSTTMTFNSFSEAIQKIMAEQSYRIEELGIDLVKALFKEQLDHGEQFIVSHHRYEITLLKSFIDEGKKTGEFTPEIDTEEWAFNLLSQSIGDTYVWCLTAGAFDLIERVNKNVQILLTAIRA